MAVLAIFTGQVTKEKYESLRKEVDWEHNNPPGGVFHAASFDDTGNIQVADVWESRESFDAFVGQRLAPALQKLGIGPPQVDVYPTYNVNAYKSIDKYKV